MDMKLSKVTNFCHMGGIKVILPDEYPDLLQVLVERPETPPGRHSSSAGQR